MCASYVCLICTHAQVNNDFVRVEFSKVGHGPWASLSQVCCTLGREREREGEREREREVSVAGLLYIM